MIEPLASAGTRLTIRIHFASAEVRDTLVAMGMTEAWSTSLDRLHECLAAAAA